jgi:hypothetical protein
MKVISRFLKAIHYPNSIRNPVDVEFIYRLKVGYATNLIVFDTNEKVSKLLVPES